MNIYPNDFETKIGFSEIRLLLYNHCLSPLGREHIDKIRFHSHYHTLQPLLKQTEEFRRMLVTERPFPQQDYIDCRSELLRLKTKGSIISLEGLRDLRIFYRTLAEIIRYIGALDSEKYPLLTSLLADISIESEIPRRIFSILDDTGEIRDRASEKLYDIRRQIRAKQTAAQKYIRKYLSEAKQNGYSPQDAEPTVRGQRLVIPVIASHKRLVGGVIHDVSATGQTVFIEPTEIYSINNEVAQLQNDERIEIIAILRIFSEFLHPHIDHCLQGAYLMGIVDFIRAKTSLALQMRAGLPIMQNKPHFIWRDARHPLLETARTDVVPLNFSLAPEERIVIISGPNAGGKSVMLKTIALLQYMLQCGLLVPMREDSEMGIIEKIFVDIGDEQSIENDLSTYSSHLRNMKTFLQNGTAQTLFLMDELGSGTEPQAGGAIAEALLEEFNDKKMYGVITTHYANLKLLAKRLNGVVNGAMLFDKNALKPTYIFQKGLPGSSFAFEMANAMGLPKSVLVKARKKTGRSHLNFEEELQQLEVEKSAVQKELAGLKIIDKLLEETLTKYNTLYDDLHAQKKKILRNAKDEALQIVAGAGAQIERAVREIKEANAEREKVKAVRKELSLYADTLLLDSEVSLPMPMPMNKSAAPSVSQSNDMDTLLKGLSKAGWKVTKKKK
ncbi:MAG: endonuclease MutS2 [Bacteroidales bacterium]|jgi:DNA mismatch repair protein MutS2|nr:endonuclease MutS2 [Bacteroidales bacterium]